MRVTDGAIAELPAAFRARQFQAADAALVVRQDEVEVMARVVGQRHFAGVRRGEFDIERHGIDQPVCRLETKRERITPAREIIVHERHSHAVAIRVFAVFERQIARVQSHSRAPLRHSYTNPTTRTVKNIPIAASPKRPIASSDTAHGKRKAISRSKMMNRIATR